MLGKHRALKDKSSTKLKYQKIIKERLKAMTIKAELEALEKLSKDVKQGAQVLGKDEVRFLVDYYYQMQNDRIATQGRIRAINQGDKDEPHAVIDFISNQVSTIENNIKKILEVYVKNDPVGIWCSSINGIGPVLTAGFLANLDVEDKPTAGHFWSYCGLNDQNRPWIGKEKTKKIIDNILGDKKSKDITYEDFVNCCVATKWKPDSLLEARGKDKKYIFYNNLEKEEYKFKKEDIIAQCAKRPYNSKLKVLCWKAGQSFVKVSNNPKDFYGKIYQYRKAYEIAKNEAGDYKEQALVRASQVGKTTEAYKWYSEGMLPPAHIQARAERKAVQLFISHLHHVMYVVRYGELPPKPYIIEKGGHAHVIEVPNFELVEKYLN